MLTPYHPHRRERRATGLALTLLVHVALLVGWQMSRPVTLPGGGPEPARMRIQWIRLPPPAVPATKPKPKPAEKAAPVPKPVVRAAAPITPLTPTTPTTPQRASPAVPAQAPSAQQAPFAPAPAAIEPAGPQPAPPQDAPAGMPSAAEILQGAKRDIGKIDRALRNENNPYIVLPPDSSQLRMRRGMGAARDLAPPKLWEAPKVETLVNNTGDGARRERVITGRKTYCITERGFNTSIDMIEKHGKQRVATCPQDEAPATRQEWRSARD